jgi:hypothetical protein
MRNLWLEKFEEKLLPFYGTMLKVEKPTFKRDAAGNLILVLGREAIRDTLVLQTKNRYDQPCGDGDEHLRGQGGREIFLAVPEDKVVLVSYEYERCNMIEDVVIHIGEREIHTRLHEHGRQPSYEYQPKDQWLECGYFDGSESDIQYLQKRAPDFLLIHSKGEEILLSGIEWFEAEEMYEGHWLVHLYWI